MNKLYQVTGYEREYTRVAVTYRYPSKRVHRVVDNRSREGRDAFALTSPPRNSLTLYIIVNVVNPAHQGAPPFCGFITSNLASNYHEGRTSYTEIDTHEASPYSFFYHGSFMSKIPSILSAWRGRALGFRWFNQHDVSTEDSERTVRSSKRTSCEFNSKRVLDCFEGAANHLNEP